MCAPRSVGIDLTEGLRAPALVQGEDGMHRLAAGPFPSP